jgi:Costars
LQYYNAISDKCVGNLMSARKHKLLSFEGEMLYQVRIDLFQKMGAKFEKL